MFMLFPTFSNYANKTIKMYNFYVYFATALLCVTIIAILKYISLSKMRIDDRDRKKKPKLSTIEVLNLLRNLKSFPVSVHKGWKLHSFCHNSRIWCQEISVDCNSSAVNVYAAYMKTRVPPQLVLQILKDVSKTSSWKPGCLATSINSRPMKSETGIKTKGIMGNYPVQHDIVIEETSAETPQSRGILSWMFNESRSLQTVQKEHKRYWHREDNGVCWHLQMCEFYQDWLFFLAQPVEDVDACLLTVLGYQDINDHPTTASYVSEVLSSLTEYIHYRKLLATPLIDLKLPTSRSERLARSYSSSDDAASPGRWMFSRFRSLVKKPSFGADKFYSAKQQLLRSTSILRHKSTSLLNVLDHNTKHVPASLKTVSLDRNKHMPKLETMKDANMNEDILSEDTCGSSTNKTVKDHSHVRLAAGNEIIEVKDLTELEKINNEINRNVTESTVVNDAHGISDHRGSEAEGSRVDKVYVERTLDADVDVDKENVDRSLDTDVDVDKEDIDRTLDADVDDQEQFDICNKNLLNSIDSKEDIEHIVSANQAAAELLTVAFQASNIDLSKSIQDQVTNSGGWMFCGLDNDVVVLKKVSMKDDLYCYLGKGIIQANPRVVWNAVRNPRTKFTYDDSLKKVDVLEKVSDSIKIVYYYHEVLQLFKTECCDMVVAQSERVDSGDKYILAFQSMHRPGVTLPAYTVRINVLPSGWIIEPVTKEKKVFTMVTYIMQIDFGNLPLGTDRSPFEDLVSKQPMSISYLRQYLRGCTYQH